MNKERVLPGIPLPLLDKMSDDIKYRRLNNKYMVDPKSLSPNSINILRQMKINRIIEE